MKKLLLILILSIVSMVTYSQKSNKHLNLNLNGYKYIYFPTLKYNNGVDIHGIQGLIKQRFWKAGLEIINEGQGDFKEGKNNPCLILSCMTSHETGLTNVSVTIHLIDCNKNVIFSITKKAIYLETYTHSTDLRRATKKALKAFKIIKYKYNEFITPIISLPEVEQSDETEESLMKYFSAETLDPIEGIYKTYQSGGNIGYYKIGIKKFDNVYKAIIIESDLNTWQPKEVKAIFEPSANKGIYSAQWRMGDKNIVETFAFLEANSFLKIEFNNPTTREKYTSTLIKMYPSANIGNKIDRAISSSGSGFFLTSDGIIVTNAHVVDGAKDIEIIVPNDKSYNGKVLLSDKNNDVALIKIDINLSEPLPYSVETKAQNGEKIFTIGYPLQHLMGNNYKVTDGIISSNSGLLDDVRFYQITAPIQPGNSGGPLFNKDGNVIGITTSKLVKSDIDNVNYAIKIAYVMNLYNMLPNSKKVDRTSKLYGKSLEDQLKQLKNFVCIIKATY
jgi:S1-C subfamily serine protease